MAAPKSDILELKYTGNHISPYAVKPSEIANLIINFEKTLLSTIKQRYPEIDVNQLLFAYHKIDDKSLDIQFAPQRAKQEVVESYQYMSGSVKHDEYEELNTEAIEGLRELTKFSKLYGCTGSFNHNGKKLSSFTPDTQIQFSKKNELSGETVIYGIVLRTGGETPTIHFKVNNEYRIVFDTSIELAKRLGSKLYEEVGLSGKAKWNTKSYRILDFKVTDIIEQEIRPVNETFSELRNLIGKYWDEVDDVNSIVG